MNKFAKFLFKFRIVVIAVVMAISGVCVYLATKVKINSDISSYLPHDSTVAETMEFLDKNFGIKGDALLVVKSGLNQHDNIVELIDKVYAVDNVSTAGMWLGALGEMAGTETNVIELLTMPNSALSTEQLAIKNMLTPIVPLFYKGQVEADGAYLEDEGYYIAYLSLEVPSNDEKAFKALDEMLNILNTSGLNYQLGGTAMDTKLMMESALGDIPTFLGIAIAMIFLILIFTTKSFIDPFIFLVTIGVAILINIGTNIILPSVSSVTFAASTILQLALSMDYSIFLTHAYNRELETGVDEFTAMRIALKKTLGTVSASALTTIAGFCALFAMRFTLGIDLGIVLAKGVLLSMMAVVVFQPCLILCLRKIVAKTKHKFLHPKMENLYKVPSKLKYVFLSLAVVLLGVTFVGQMNVEYYYLITLYNENAVESQQVMQSLGSRQVIVAPQADNEQKQNEFLQKVFRLNDDGDILVKDVISLKTFTDAIYAGANVNSFDELQGLPQQINEGKNLIILTANEQAQAMGQVLGITISVNSYDDLVNLKNLVASIAPQLAPQLQMTIDMYDSLSEREQDINELIVAVKAIRQQFVISADDGKNYTFYYVYVAGTPESQQALDTLQKIHNIYAEVFPDGILMSAGGTQSVLDMQKITSNDFLVIALLSAVLIFVIVALFFKSFLKAFLVTLVIELGIFINLSLNVVMGSSINFVTYIIISAIQLGATVDYAILLTNKFIEARRTIGDRKLCVKSAMTESVFSIIVSASILVSACMSVYLFSSDVIIKEITLMIARGSFISGVLVVFLLPSIYLIGKNTIKPVKVKIRKTVPVESQED